MLDKPAGFSVHNESPSLQEKLAELLPQAKPHFVNRLDRETSGLLIATTRADFVAPLQAELHGEGSRSKKLYRGIVKKPRDFDANQASWIWSQAVSDKAEGRKNPLGAGKDRVPSETRVKVVRHNDWFMELEFELITGRQHQIRKHCAHFEMPLIGDGRYGREALNQKVHETYKTGRMMLHAWSLQFSWKTKALEFQSPLPSEFDSLF